MQNSRIIEKMRKLMAMANDKSSENEAATALRQLHILLAKHNMSISQIESADNTKEEIQESFEEHKDRPWKRSVALAIARLYFCEMYYVKLGGSKSNYVFVGTETNRTFAMAIFNMVVKTVERESRAESRKIYGKEVSGFVNSFWTGAMGRICDRCDKLIQAAKKGDLEDEGGTDLPAMLNTYEEHRNRVNSFIESNLNLKAGKRKKLKATHLEGVIAGQATGDKVQLNRALGSVTSASSIEGK